MAVGDSDRGVCWEKQKYKNGSFWTALVYSVERGYSVSLEDGGVTQEASQSPAVLRYKMRVLRNTKGMAQAKLLVHVVCFVNCSNAFKQLGCFRILRNPLVHIRYYGS